uniref:Uncharacterized protein n=1 Tax=Oryza glumipatula TaxID=40148 RepID=A0A0E0B4T3_9ORYZ
MTYGVRVSPERSNLCDGGCGALRQAATAAAAEAAGDPDDELWPWDEFPEDAVFVKDDFATVQAKFSRESGEAAAALKDAAADVFRPLLDNFNHLRSLNTVFDTEDYHVGMPFVVMVVMAINDINNCIYWLDAIRAPVYFRYGLTFAFELAGIKKCVKYLLASATTHTSERID